MATAQTKVETEKKVVELKSKFGKQENFTATDGTEYTFQFPGTRKVQEMLDTSKVRGAVSDLLYNEQIMEHVIVQPLGVNWEYWDEHEGYREVTEAADNFLGSLL